MALRRSHTIDHALLHFVLIVHLSLLFAALCTADKTAANLEMTLHYYSNPRYIRQDGLICDKSKQGCDLSFSIYVTSDKGKWADKLSFEQKDAFMSATYVLFRDKIGSFHSIWNPMTVKLTTEDLKRGRITIEIVVDDKDEDSVTQRVDTFNMIVETNPPIFIEKQTLFTAGKTDGQQSFITIGYLIKCNNPFMYGKVCDEICIPQNSAEGGHYLCDHAGKKACMKGWIDPTKDCKVPSLCISRPCLNGGTCTDLPMDNMFWCLCTSYFTGQVCEKPLLKCNTNDCLNGGTCIRHSTGNIECECPKGYEGDKCQNDVNWCNTYAPCGKGSTCYAQKHGYTCACAPGLLGKNCDEDVDECSEKSENPCAHGGTCVNTPGSFTCLCPPGLNGILCESDIDECQLKPPPCKLNEKCVNTIGGHVCPRIEVDDCIGVVCGGGGACIDMPFKYYCQCKDGFSGMNCSYSVSGDFMRQLEAIGGAAATTATVGLAAVAIVVAMATGMALHPDGL